MSGVAKITDLQEPTAKMSKSSSSAAGIIDVLDEPGAIRKKIARAVTDPGSEVRADEKAKPGVTNLLRIYSALTGADIPALEVRYAGAGYGTFKKDLAEVVVGALAPIRERTEKLLADESELDRLLAHGADRARPVARGDHGHGHGPGGLPPPARRLSTADARGHQRREHQRADPRRDRDRGEAGRPESAGRPGWSPGWWAPVA